jgi:hypothetical protein
MSVKTRNSRHTPRAEAALYATSQILGESPKRSCRQDSTGRNPIACKNKKKNTAQAWLQRATHFATHQNER